jgi:hypothetical protein
VSSDAVGVSADVIAVSSAARGTSGDGSELFNHAIGTSKRGFGVSGELSETLADAIGVSVTHISASDFTRGHSGAALVVTVRMAD